MSTNGFDNAMSNKQKIQGIKCKCIEKKRDNKGNIIGYIFKDQNGQVKGFERNMAKQLIKSGKFNCVNLQIDKAGRLVDKAEEKEKVQTVRVTPVPCENRTEAPKTKEELKKERDNERAKIIKWLKNQFPLGKSDWPYITNDFEELDHTEFDKKTNTIHFVNKALEDYQKEFIEVSVKNIERHCESAITKEIVIWLPNFEWDDYEDGMIRQNSDMKNMPSCIKFAEELNLSDVYITSLLDEAAYEEKTWIAAFGLGILGPCYSSDYLAMNQVIFTAQEENLKKFIDKIPKYISDNRHLIFSEDDLEKYSEEEIIDILSNHFLFNCIPMNVNRTGARYFTLYKLQHELEFYIKGLAKRREYKLYRMISRDIINFVAKDLCMSKNELFNMADEDIVDSVIKAFKTLPEYDVQKITLDDLIQDFNAGGLKYKWLDEIATSCVRNHD